MKIANYKNLSTEELLQRKKMFKMLRAISLICMVLILGLVTYLLITEDYTIDIPILIIFFVLIGILPYNYKNIKSIDAELKSKEQDQS